MYASALPIVRSAAEALRPPKRVSVSQGAHQHLMISQPGGYTGPWAPTETPYMVEPMDMLGSRQHEAVVFVGPSRSGKTLALVDAWVTYAVKCDPGDMLVVQMTQEKAREYSKVRIGRAIRHSPELKAMLSVGSQDDNTHDKMFKHGMWLKLGWPSASQLASSDYRYVAFTDYDRMDDGIDGEGSAFGLGLTRVQNFLSRGMCMVESSPGREITDPRWKARTPHEGPPCTGILGIYNRSDRRRWYWACPDCGEYFQAKPGLELFTTLPGDNELLDMVRSGPLNAIAGEHAKVGCPHCGVLIESRHKTDMNARARWVQDSVTIDRHGQIHGDPMKSSIVGYWLGGVAAAYQSWERIILRYLQAMREFVLTGSEETLRTTVNTAQGAPYLPRNLSSDGSIEESLQNRAETMERYFVPDGVRVLIASVDVQGGSKSRFEIMVTGYGKDGERWIIDRYALRESKRAGQRISPAAFSEDWDILTEKVVQSSYRLPDGRELRVHRTAVDVGGEQGVTDNAYKWWRRLRRARLGNQVMLVKGGSTRNAARVKKTFPDTSGRKDRGASSGNVPVWLLNTDLIKDAVWNSLHRPDPGPGYVHLPEWLPRWAYEEMTSEIRGKDGKWTKIPGRANETFDLSVYGHAVWIDIGGEKIRWDNPPPWAGEWDVNLNACDKDRSPRPEKPQRAVLPGGTGGGGAGTWF